MRILGLDLGSRTCGIAISDPLGMIARTVETYRFEDDNYELASTYVSSLCKELKVDEIVLGLPKHMNGDVGIRGEISMQFKDLLVQKTGLKVILIDERLSSVAANKLLISADVSRKKRKQVVDQVAAVHILQGYLDSKK